MSTHKRPGPALHADRAHQNRKPRAYPRTIGTRVRTVGAPGAPTGTPARSPQAFRTIAETPAGPVLAALGERLVAVAVAS